MLSGSPVSATIQVLNELVGDSSLERFRVEYEKLYRAVKKSHDNEKRLVKKCRELNAEIVSNAAKVQTALKLSEEDQTTIVSLKKEVEKAWKQVDEAREKESQARDNIKALKIEIQSLQRVVEQGANTHSRLSPLPFSLPPDDTSPAGAGLNVGGEEEALNEMLRQKDDIVKERDGLVDQIARLRSDSLETTEKLKRAEQEKLQLLDEIASLKEQINARKLESDRQLRLKDKLEREVKDLRSTLDSRQNEIRNKQQLVAQAEESIGRYENMVRDTKQQVEKMKREYNSLVERALKLQQDLDEQGRQNTQLQSDISTKTLEIKSKEVRRCPLGQPLAVAAPCGGHRGMLTGALFLQDEITGLRNEIAKINKIKEASVSKMKTLEKLKADTDKDRDSLKQELATMERELELTRREVALEKKKQDDLMRERDVLTKKREQASDLAHDDDALPASRHPSWLVGAARGPVLAAGCLLTLSLPRHRVAGGEQHAEAGRPAPHRREQQAEPRGGDRGL